MRDSVDVRCIAHICTRMIYVECWILFCQWSRRAGAWRLLSACLGIRASSIRIFEDPRTRCLFGPRMVFRREGLNSAIMGCPPRCCLDSARGGVGRRPLPVPMSSTTLSGFTAAFSALWGARHRIGTGRGDTTGMGAQNWKIPDDIAVITLLFFFASQESANFQLRARILRKKRSLSSSPHFFWRFPKTLLRACDLCEWSWLDIHRLKFDSETKN